MRRHHPTGLSPLDTALPGGGLPGGAITECFGDPGDGRVSLVLQILRQLLQYDRDLHGDRCVLLVDSDAAGRHWYPPTLAQAGLPLERLLIVRPTRQTDTLWAIEQGLRSPAVLAVVAHVPWIHPAAARRLQLAAESGGGDTLAVLLRPLRELGLRGGGAVQLVCRALPLPPDRRLVDPHARCSRIIVHRCRGGAPGAMCDVTWRPDQQRHGEPTFNTFECDTAVDPVQLASSRSRLHLRAV